MTPVSVLDQIPLETSTVYPGQTAPARFFVAVLGVRERNRLFATLADEGTMPQDHEMREAARVALPIVFPDRIAELTAILDQLDEHDDTEEPDDPDGKAAHRKAGAKLGRLFNTQIHNPLTRADYEPYKVLQRQRLEWRNRLDFLRVQFALCGWEHGPCEFTTTQLRAERGFRHGVTIAADDCVNRLSEADFDALNTKALSLSEVSKTDRGN